MNADEKSLPPLFLEGNKNANPGNGGGVRCLRCGKRIKGKPVQVFQDFRVGGEFHDLGGIPEKDSMGPYDVGPDCAEALRERARFFLRKAGLEY
ncbi:hypothetical protein [Candidatus Burkholderia verschuerenii]|uniref:hypothetical protein n=1 Tax=Candidatus Burkholderia verschuerenii TaxID=242163 RepID=UPI00067BFE98|nr:hypothetical protein [Candidatus Burkholderia verschuerenii]